jgi:hypothetical protein
VKKKDEFDEVLDAMVENNDNNGTDELLKDLKEGK